MFGVKCTELIKELKRCDIDCKGFLPNYNDKVLQEVFEEMQDLFDQNKLDVAKMPEEDNRDELFMAIKMRHYGMIRNHRCVHAYLLARLKYIKSLRWGFGTNIPQEIRKNMSENESKWFEFYNKLLFNYMKNVSEDGMDLCLEQDPPKFRFITLKGLFHANSLGWGSQEVYQYMLESFNMDSSGLLARVRCLSDYGDLMLSDGTKVSIKKGLQHLLPRKDCEQLIRQGVLQHVIMT